MREHRSILKMLMKRSLFVGACGLMPIAAWAAGPPVAPAAETKYEGCVQHVVTDKDTLVLSGETYCAKLTGKFSPADLDGHEVELKGVLTERSPGVPASISVGSVVTVGKSCSSTCSLLPRTRGLGKGGEIPGKEGGTPGAAPTQPPPAQ
jgi:hypothetical protein